MLGYLRGQVLDNGIASGDGKIILGVGSEAQGFVGYSVNVPKNPDYELIAHGKVIELFIYTHVREDSLDLYGFSTRPEKEMFLTLLSVNGIGPKGALSILSNVDASQLIQMVIDEDTALLTKIPGIGKKTAERVVLELAEPLRKKVDAGMRLGKGPTGASARDMATASGSGSQSVRDAVSALVGLGFREIDVTALVSKAASESGASRTEDLIKIALRQLG